MARIRAYGAEDRPGYHQHGLAFGALLGKLTGLDRLQPAIEERSMGASVSRVLLEIKVPLAVLVHGLFKLTWSLRQMNYIEALMGAAPELPPTRARRDAWGRPSVGCSAAP